MNPLQELVNKLQFLTQAQLRLLLSMTEDMLLSNRLPKAPMPEQWETPSIDLHNANPEEALLALAQMDFIAARSNSTYRHGKPMEGAETQSPIRMPNKKELQQLYKAVEAGNHGRAVPESSDSDSSSRRNNKKPGEADT